MLDSRRTSSPLFSGLGFRYTQYIINTFGYDFRKAQVPKTANRRSLGDGGEAPLERGAGKQANRRKKPWGEARCEKIGSLLHSQH
jgi:hypothetical protein